jgi:hypothetical protein
VAKVVAKMVANGGKMVANGGKNEKYYWKWWQNGIMRRILFEFKEIKFMGGEKNKEKK